MITVQPASSGTDFSAQGGLAQSCILQVFPHVIGQKGRTKLKVEQDTGASITIPRKNSTAPPGSREADDFLFVHRYRQ